MMQSEANMPLIGKSEKTNSQALYHGVWFIFGVVLGALIVSRKDAHIPNAELSVAELSEDTYAQGNGIQFFQEAPKQSPESPVGVGVAVLEGITANDLVARAKGGITSFADEVGQLESIFMKATGTDFCWAATGYNALRMGAKSVWDANDGTTNTGFVRDAPRNARQPGIPGERPQNNITPKMPTFVVRMKRAGSGYYMRSSEGGCDSRLWDKNTEDFMGTTKTTLQQKEWPCYGWGSAAEVLKAFNMETNSIGCVGSKCKDDITKAFDDGHPAVIVGLTYGPGPYRGTGCGQLIHFMLIAGYDTGSDYFFILDPAGAGGSNQLDPPAASYTDEALKPFKMRKLTVDDNTGEQVSSQVMIDPTAPVYNYIISYSVVKSTASTKIVANFLLAGQH